MGRFKKPVPKTVKCEDCGRLFGNERDLAQHLNSKAHGPVINHDEGTLPIVCSPPATSDAPSFQPPVPRPMSFDDKPEGVEFPRKDAQLQSSTYQRLFWAKAKASSQCKTFQRARDFSLRSRSSRYRVLGQNCQSLKKRLRESSIYSRNTTKGLSFPSTIVHPAILTR